MFYEEKVEDGAWFFRNTPDGKWRPFTTEMLQEKITELQSKLDELCQTST